MSAKKMTSKRIAYCGRRQGTGGKMLDAFVLADEDLADFLCYSAARSCRFIIGQVYDGDVTDDHTMAFNTFKIRDDDRVVPGLVDEWSAADAVARRANANEVARKKLQAEYRVKWLERLEPLRRQYRQLPITQRRAMRQLLIEWLESAREISS